MSRAFLLLLILFLAIEPLNIKSQVTLNRTIPEPVLQKRAHLKRMYTVRVTMYNPVKEQTNEDPNIVADGTKFDTLTASSLNWVALSRDQLTRWGGPFNYGDIVYLDIPDSQHSGFYKVKDTMNPRFLKHVDILKTVGHSIFAFDIVDMYKVCTDEDKEIVWNTINNKRDGIITIF